MLPLLTRKNHQEKSDIEKRLNAGIVIPSSAAQAAAHNRVQRDALTTKEAKRARILAPWEKRHTAIKLELACANTQCNNISDVVDCSSAVLTRKSLECQIERVAAERVVAAVQARLDEHIAAKPDPKDWELDAYLAAMEAIR